MKSVTVESLRSDIETLLDEVTSSNEPVLITGPHGSAVLVSEEDWDSIQETLYLMSIPGLVESIHEAAAEPLEESSDDPGW